MELLKGTILYNYASSDIIIELYSNMHTSCHSLPDKLDLYHPDCVRINLRGPMNTGEVYSLIEEGGITKYIMTILTACNLGGGGGD